MIETIKLFFVNIWSWFIENKDAIIAFVMSGQFASIIATIFMTIKNIKRTRENTNSTNNLTDVLNKNAEMSKVLDQINTNVQKLSAVNSLLLDEIKKRDEKFNNVNLEVINKLNAILEVQTIVYSTIRDDRVRTTVNNILNNARYSDKNFKESIQLQIEDLKSEFEHKMDEMNISVHDTIDKVSNAINIEETAKQRMKELENSDMTRY